MNKNIAKSNAVTGKTAMNIVGSAVVNGDVIPIFTHNPNSIREMLENMCDVCINCVKNGKVEKDHIWCKSEDGWLIKTSFREKAE